MGRRPPRQPQELRRRGGQDTGLATPVAARQLPIGGGAARPSPRQSRTGGWGDGAARPYPRQSRGGGEARPSPRQSSRGAAAACTTLSGKGRSQRPCRYRRRVTWRWAAARRLKQAAARRPSPPQEPPQRGKGRPPSPQRITLQPSAARRGVHHVVRVGGLRPLRPPRGAPPRLPHDRRCGPSSPPELQHRGVRDGGSTLLLYIGLQFFLYYLWLTPLLLQERTRVITAMDPQTIVNHWKVRRHLQPDAIVRDGVPDHLVFQTVEQYCAAILVTDTFVQVTEPTPPPGDPPQRVYHKLSEKAQSVIRGMFVIQKDLFDQDLCLQQIQTDSFVVDTLSREVFLSKRAYSQDLIHINKSEKEQKIKDNMSSLSDVVVRNVVGTNPLPDEVSQGLIPLMKKQGFEMLHVILNHPSLVPIWNLIPLSIRLYNHLFEVVRRQNRSEYNKALQRIKFPGSWHTLVQANPLLNKFYHHKGANYSKLTRNLVQQATVMRFNRNAPSHGMSHCIDANLAMQYIEPDIALLLYTVFPLYLSTLLWLAFKQLTAWWSYRWNISSSIPR